MLKGIITPESVVIMAAFVVPTLIFVAAAMTTALFGEDAPEESEGRGEKGK